MSTVGGGSATSGWESLSALLEFVKSPEYVVRIKELSDLEARSRNAHDEATASIAELTEQSRQLAADKASHEAAVSQLATDQAAHDKRVALWNKAMDEVGKAMRGEE